MLEYVPRRQLETMLWQGWRLIPGHTYDPDEYAILMSSPPAATILSIPEVSAIISAFHRNRPLRLSNLQAGAVSRSWDAKTPRIHGGAAYQFADRDHTHILEREIGVDNDHAGWYTDL